MSMCSMMYYLFVSFWFDFARYSGALGVEGPREERTDGCEGHECALETVQTFQPTSRRAFLSVQIQFLFAPLSVRSPAQPSRSDLQSAAGPTKSRASRRFAS